MTSFVEQIKAHVWPATRLALANYCGLKDGEAIVNASANLVRDINVHFVDSPNPHKGVDPPLDIDLEPNPPPHLQLPKRDAYPMEPPEPEPIAQEQPYRTELDIPGALTPWYKKPLTGRTPNGR